jgi:hypothetical protein
MGVIETAEQKPFETCKTRARERACRMIFNIKKGSIAKSIPNQL